jgi:hypothetical protein
MVLGSLPAVSRRAIAVMGVLAIVAVTSVSGIKAQQAPAAAPPDQFKFDVSSMFLFLTVSADGVSSFETTMTKVKEALAKSEKPERKQQAAHWKVFKSAQPDGSVIFIWQLDQVVKEASYDPFKLLQEGGMAPADIKALYDKVGPSIKGINMMALAPVADMGGM